MSVCDWYFAHTYIHGRLHIGANGISWLPWKKWMKNKKAKHTFNGPLSGITRVGRYQKAKTNLDFTEARDSEWQWHQLGHMQVCTLLQADNHASTPPLSFLQAGCPSCHPTNSVKALKAKKRKHAKKTSFLNGGERWVRWQGKRLALCGPHIYSDIL